MLTYVKLVLTFYWATQLRLAEKFSRIISNIILDCTHVMYALPMKNFSNVVFCGKVYKTVI